MGKIGSAGMSSGPTVVSLKNLDCSKAEVSYQTDKRRIFNHIAGVAEMDGLRMDENRKHQLQDVRGMGMDEDGKQRLQDHPHDPCAEYEKELVVAYSHKFEQLNQTVQQAALRDITAQDGGNMSSRARTLSIGGTDRTEESNKFKWLKKFLRDRVVARYPGAIYSDLDRLDDTQELRRYAFDNEHLVIKHPRRCTVSDVTQRGLTLAQLREFWETVKADLKAKFRMHTKCFKTGACKLACVCDEYGVCTCGQHGEPCTCRITAENVNNYQICTLYTRPHTEPDQCSYFELMATGPQPPDFYPTTAWATSFSDYISGIEWHAESRGLPDTTVYWDGTFANNQHRLSEEISNTLADSSMSRVLRECRGVVLVLPAPESRHPDHVNCKKGICVHPDHLEPWVVTNDCCRCRGGNVHRCCMTGWPLKRIWIVQELHEAVANNKLLDITTTGGALAGNEKFPDGSVEYGDIGPGLAWPLLEFDAASAEASFAQDKVMILDEMGDAGITALNKTVRSLGIGPILRDAAERGDMQAVQKLSDMQRDRGDTLNLATDPKPGSVGEYALHVAAAAGQSEMLQ